MPYYPNYFRSTLVATRSRATLASCSSPASRVLSSQDTTAMGSRAGESWGGPSGTYPTWRPTASTRRRNCRPGVSCNIKVVLQLRVSEVEARNSRNLFRDEHWQPHCVSTVAAAHDVAARRFRRCWFADKAHFLITYMFLW